MYSSEHLDRTGTGPGSEQICCVNSISVLNSNPPAISLMASHLPRQSCIFVQFSSLSKTDLICQQTLHILHATRYSTSFQSSHSICFLFLASPSSSLASFSGCGKLAWYAFIRYSISLSRTRVARFRVPTLPGIRERSGN